MNRNCPFYGHSLAMHEGWPKPFVLLSTSGNQCALIVDAHSPCRLEVGGHAVEWRECPLVKAIRFEVSGKRVIEHGTRD